MTMPEVDARLGTLLRAALDLPVSERQAFILAESAGDVVLLQQLRQLLAFDQSDSLPLDVPLDALAADLLAGSAEAHAEACAEACVKDQPSAQEGARIGPYRLIEVLGRGGMGTVWLAERNDGQFAQKVALKLIRLGMANAYVERQFRHERDLLARLRHPNIAALVDGGLDEHGRPWFAMEHVQGVTLGVWSQGEDVSLHERLVLFVKLCRGVAHAHQHLIVHRDLKPSNVLVQADGEPRLLDFGIAKLVQQDDSEHSATTHRFLTRDFAAPEQLRGEPLGTATDVYALGLMLFELLTGMRYRRVHDDDELTLRPSAAASKAPSTNTITGPVSRAALRGDLDAIVLHSLANEPARRYPGAQQLADDVQRHLDGKPIEARADGFMYRSSKFVGRNRAAVTMAVLGLVGLLVVSGVAIQQAIQKSAEAERARTALRQSEAVRDFITSVFLDADPALRKGADTTAGELLAAAHKRIATELADEPAVAAQLLDQIGNTYVSMGERELARAALTEALVFNQRAARPALDIAASAGARLAYFHFSDGNPTQAIAKLDAIIERLQAETSKDSTLNAPLGKTLELKGNILYAIGREEPARQANQAAVAVWHEVRNQHAAEYLMAEISLADLEAALGNGKDSLAGADRVLADPLLHDKDVPPALLIQAHAVRIRGLQTLGRHAEAEPLLRQTIADFAAQYGADGSMTRYWRFRYAESLRALGKWDQAQAVADAVLALPPDGTAAYRRIRVEVLAAQIAHDRGTADAATRIANVTIAACGEGGNEELCVKARQLAARISAP